MSGRIVGNLFNMRRRRHPLAQWIGGTTTLSEVELYLNPAEVDVAVYFCFVAEGASAREQIVHGNRRP